MVIEAPCIASKAQPGHFVVVMADETSERIPLTIADYDRQRGTITLVLMVVGTSTQKLSQLEVGDAPDALIGPLGKPSKIENVAAVIMVAGGVGTAPIHPIARTARQQGSRVLCIQGARTAGLMFWQDKMASLSHQHIITTDDGSCGRKGLVTEPLKELLESDGQGQIGCVYAVGPAVMMKACVETTRPFGVKTVVSLNTIMVDGTGMCGGCRVRVGDHSLFACVDGPEFDGHLVDWDLVIARQRLYAAEEKCSLDHYLQEVQTG